ncbi:alpha/beta hydrolase [Roseibium sp. RKSG952]|uniref:alpha/beta hydrolase n=1 Tax=Roseibium sp. RKSG952 TaxID=2529384 RepID=UPI0012BBFFD8|nr:alpha/beta hydrolase [Roseibium sp. RKSG952]MTI00057.1 alpha/beta hydrolase [Roseibium sp. RKSG952]
MPQHQLNGPSLPPRSGDRARQLVVLLHGYGANGADLIDLGRIWSSSLPDAAFVAPDAPEPLPFDGFGGRQWFALAERDIREYRLGVETAGPVLQDFISEQLSELGLEAADLVIAGFSQGAMMALFTGLTRSDPPAGILAYSGAFAGPKTVTAIAVPPVAMIHGAEDDVVSSNYLEAANVQLQALGVDVKTYLLEGLGHSIDQRGLTIGARFLQDRFGG